MSNILLGYTIQQLADFYQEACQEENPSWTLGVAELRELYLFNPEEYLRRFKEAFDLPLPYQ